MRRTASMEYGFAVWRIHAAARSRLPLGAKIAALHEPSAGAVTHTHIRIRVSECRCGEFHIEIEFSGPFLAHETGIAILQHIEEIRVGGVHPDGDAADGNHHAVALDLCG